MASEHEVMREFLVSLGFVVKDAEQKKFTGALEKTTKTAMNTGKAVLAVGLAAQTMVALFTANMEKMYYASRRTGASVENLQAAEFGARNIGLAAGTATASLEAMAAAVRTNPGLRGMMNNILGKDTSKMDQMEAMLELVQKLSSMPHYVGAQFAQMFGVDEKTFLMMKQGMPEMLAAMDARKRLNADAGINPDDAAKASKEYQNMLRGILEKIDVIGAKLSIALLDPAREFAKVINATLDRIIGFKPEEVKKEVADVKGWIKGDLNDPNKPAPKNAMKAGGKFGGSMSDLWDFLKGKRGLTTDAPSTDKTPATPGTPPTVTDDDRSVAPGKVDLRKMTAEEHAKVLALAAKQFSPELRNRPKEWNGINADYKAGQPARNASQLEILQQELAGETNAANRARLERELARLGGGSKGIAPTGTGATVAAAAAPATTAPVTVTQNNNITMDGVRGDNVDTRMTSVFQRAQADLIRNFKGATQ